MGNIPTKQEMDEAFAGRHGNDLQKVFAGSTVAVCGLGGLGSNIAVALARAGIGKLILIDFDKVDITNLHRQQYKASQIGMFKTAALIENLNEISPYIEIEAHTARLKESNINELVYDADIICEAFDNAEEKAMLVNHVFENFPRKYLVASSGMAGLGSSNDIKTRKITEHFYLCGDGISDLSDGDGLFSSRVMLCASHQAHMVLRILAGQYDS